MQDVGRPRVAIINEAMAGHYFPGGDAVYHLSFTFDHTATDLVLNFIGGPGLTGVADESWGLDNVRVTGPGAHSSSG